MTTRGVGAFLAVLASFSLGINFYIWLKSGELQIALLSPALVLVSMLFALPFITGWRPFAARAEQTASCAACGALWISGIEGGRTCPACGQASALSA